MKKYFVLFLAVLVIVGLVGCHHDTSISSEEGILYIQFPAVTPLSTILPDIDMTIASYDITGSGPNGRSFEYTDITPGQPYKVEGLYHGVWEITVKGKNANGMYIGAGSATAVVVARETTSVSITITPIEGTGNFEVSILWNAETLQLDNPRIEAILIPRTGVPYDLNFTLDATTGTGNCSLNDLPDGYYTLKAKLFDLDFEVYGAAVTVRIVKDGLSKGELDFVKGNPPVGFILFDINISMYPPLEITIAAESNQILVEESLTLFASVEDVTENVVYVWNVNGTYKAISQEYTIYPGDLYPGNYRIDVYAFTADWKRAGSKSFDLTITE